MEVKRYFNLFRFFFQKRYNLTGNFFGVCFSIVFFCFSFCVVCYAGYKDKLILPFEKVPSPINVRDDGGIRELGDALRYSLKYFKKTREKYSFVLNGIEYSSDDIHQTIKYFLRIVQKHKTDTKRLYRSIQKYFFFYSFSPKKKLLVTAYYTPKLPISWTKNDVYKYPLYKRPSNLERNKKYYTRSAIDSDGILRGKNLEIAWAKDPMAVFFFHIQGSGYIYDVVSQKNALLVYNGSNGYPYRSVGEYMMRKKILPKNVYSRKKMVQFINKQKNHVRQKILNHNPRYIFFKKSKKHVIVGSLNVPLVRGRSVALDHTYYPKGGLLWLSTQYPNLKKHESTKMTRFVINQDKGSAIKGTGKLDFFLGDMEKSKMLAEHFHYPGEIFLVVLKKKYLQK